MPEISIIVPIYNVEKYLDKCVLSIINQTFSDIEIILVDDGSKDSSGDLCDQWAKKDSRVLSLHKQNGGLSDARNYGIEASHGKYVGLVDGDDFVKPDMFATLYQILIKNDADISMCGFADYYKDNIRNDSDDKSVYVWNQEETIRNVLIGKQQSVHAVTKLYKRTLFDNVKYPYGKTSEDAFVIMDILDQVKKVAYTPYAGYYYVHREGSITTGKYRPSDKARLEAYEKILNYIKAKWSQYTDIAEIRYFDANLVLADKIVLNHIDKNNIDYKEVKKYLRKHCSKAFFSNSLKLGKKIRLALILISDSLYRKYVSIVNGRV